MSDGIVRFEGSLATPQGARFAIVAGRFNELIVGRLIDGALDALRRHGVPEANILIAKAPGAFELPLLCQRIAASGKVDAVIALGCVIRGDTIHFEIVSMESSRALMDLAVARKFPLGNGIITVNTEEQAWARARVSELNKGGDAARAALAVLRIKRRLAKG